MCGGSVDIWRNEESLCQIRSHSRSCRSYTTFGKSSRREEMTRRTETQRDDDSFVRLHSRPFKSLMSIRSFMLRKHTTPTKCKERASIFLFNHTHVRVANIEQSRIVCCLALRQICNFHKEQRTSMHSPLESHAYTQCEERAEKEY